MFANEMDEIQSAMLDATSKFRNSIAKDFAENFKSYNRIDSTLNDLFAYFSDRSQAISHLASYGYAWDAEIILRCAYEVAGKIWLICLYPKDGRGKLIEEFWGISAEIHNRKKARKANLAKQLHILRNAQYDSKVFDFFEDKEIFPHDEINKKERKGIEQKWSFTEIINYLEANHPKDFPMKYITCLLFNYDAASHLIHADDHALDLMLDRELRDPEELTLLTLSHTIRIWSDLVSLWYMSAETLRYHFGIREKNRDLYMYIEKFSKVSDPIRARFNQTQEKFYNTWQEKKNSI